jgi:hypothetical protein
MVKSLDLPLRVYEDIEKVSQELSLMAKKPISKSMAIDMLIEIYHAHLGNPCTLDMFSSQLQNANIMSPEEFDKYWDEPAKPQIPKHKTKPKTKTP